VLGRPRAWHPPTRSCLAVAMVGSRLRYCVPRGLQRAATLSPQPRSAPTLHRVTSPQSRRTAPSDGRRLSAFSTFGSRPCVVRPRQIGSCGRSVALFANSREPTLTVIDLPRVPSRLLVAALGRESSYAAVGVLQDTCLTQSGPGCTRISSWPPRTMPRNVYHGAR